MDDVSAKTKIYGSAKININTSAKMKIYASAKILLQVLYHYGFVEHYLFMLQILKSF